MINNPVVNILTRIHLKEDYFKICRESISSQTYKKVNHIIGSDTGCSYYPDAVRLIKEYQRPIFIPDGMYYAPWNLHLNTLATYVKEGWVLAIDEDDRFVAEDSLQTIIHNIDHENQLLIWKVKIMDHLIVPSYSFGRYIQSGDISGIGFMYHSKHLPVDWGNLSYGDYRVANQLIYKGLTPKWINQILTQTIDGAHRGK